MQHKIETGRLLLRSITRADGKAMHDFLMRNYDFFKPWSPAYEEDYTELEHHISRSEKQEKDAVEGRGIKFAIYKKEDIARIIGTCAVSNIVRGPFQSCYIGYRVDQNENGKGYATEAIAAVVDYAFNALGLHRIEANIIPRNKASIAAVEKLGFSCEGLAKKYLQINGVWEDHFHYILLNEKSE